MRLETGDWTIGQPSWWPKKQQTFHRYDSRIVIPTEEFERLQTGRFEPHNQLTPFTVWLHDEVGSPFQGAWDLDWIDGSEVIYFAHFTDAAHFLLRWGS